MSQILDLFVGPCQNCQNFAVSQSIDFNLNRFNHRCMGLDYLLNLFVVVETKPRRSATSLRILSYLYFLRLTILAIFSYICDSSMV